MLTMARGRCHVGAASAPRLDQLFVAPEYQGKDLGRKLLLRAKLAG